MRRCLRCQAWVAPAAGYATTCSCSMRPVECQGYGTPHSSGGYLMCRDASNPWWGRRASAIDYLPTASAPSYLSGGSRMPASESACPHLCVVSKCNTIYIACHSHCSGPSTLARTLAASMLVQQLRSLHGPQPLMVDVTMTHIVLVSAPGPHPLFEPQPSHWDMPRTQI